jgi:hypothetical protein
MTHEDIIDYCYNMRGPEVQEIKERSRDVPDDFSNLAHYIGRLGATRSAVNTVVRAMAKVPALCQISIIRTVDAPETKDITVLPDFSNPYEIVLAICKDLMPQNPMLTINALCGLDLLLDGDIRAKLASRRTVLTRVHAELQLADKLSRIKHFSFVDDDKVHWMQ